MSYASVASHNIPFGEMPKPDQSLADGHFNGETQAHVDVDSKVNVLPAGSDPNHPDVHPHGAPHPAAVHLNPIQSSDPHVSDSAPKPTPALPKGSIHIPQSGAEWEKTHKEAKKDVKKAEKKGEEVIDKAEKKASAALTTAEKKGAAALDAAEKKGKEVADKAEKKGKEIKRKVNEELDEAGSAIGPYWEKTKDVVLRPGPLGGLMGVVNVGLLSTIGYFAYTRRDQPWDRRIVGGAVAGTLALFGAEGYVADSYLQTDEGQAEAERAKREGSKLYLQAKEVILRPGVAGGLAGAVNVAVLGTVGYFSYQNWNQPWDRRVVSAVTVGLLGLSGLEGYAGKVYTEKELPKRR